MNPLLEQFLIEARENLKFIEQNLEDLENADDELVNAIFRAAHTMKGGSGIVGFESLKALTHKAEDLLDKMRSKHIEYKPEIQEVLYDVFDEVLNLVEAAESSGDVVSANLDIEASLLKRLDLILGVDSSAPVEFVVPFVELKDTSLVVNQELPLIANTKLSFEPVVITEQNYLEEHTYAMFFDLTSDCMKFGNDPIYALSLLDDKLLAINSQLSLNSAKEILTASGENELIELHLAITAFTKARWFEIEESVYNFLDDIVFMPLSISRLLEVNSGQRQAVEFIKDFCISAKSLIASKDISGLALAIERSLELINQETLQARMLKRLKDVLPLICDGDILKLNGFIDALEQNKPYSYDNDSSKIEEPAMPDLKTIEVNAVKAEQASKPKPQTKPADNSTSFSDKEKEMIVGLLKQQADRLQTSSAIRFAEQIRTAMAQCAKALNMPMPPKTINLSSLNSWANGDYSESEIMPTTQKQDIAIAAAKTTVVDTPTVSQEIQIQDTPKIIAKPQPAQQAQVDKKDIIGKVVKIEQSSIDTLMSVVGELLVAKNSLPYLADSVYELTADATKRAIMEKYSHVNRLTDQLQDLIMSMRMLPISYVFDRYPKLVREISKNLNKKVKLIQEGGETKLDKNMIEMLADPLIHIVRNSLDHGIEAPSERDGKDDTGTLVMKAYPQSDKVILEIIDDGKGIDPQRVASKVLEKGLLPVEKIETMSDQEKIELVMLPGLSTAETVSEYSGRGVGMDVVKKSIESFGGTIVINSELGKGTKITLSIPVSLAVSTLLHVLMDKEHYGFPMDAVSETVKMDWDKITYLHNEPYIYLRDQVIPIIFLKGMLDSCEIKTKPLSLVVLSVRGNPIAVAVNELIGQLEVVQKPLEGLLTNHALISGTALLGNGQIIMIIDPISVLDLGESVRDKHIILEDYTHDEI